MKVSSNPGRTAGLLYLCLLGAPLRLIYIPKTLIVPGDAAATASNIASHETLFRLGIFFDLVTGTMSIFLMLALYRLFKGIDKELAVLMVILGAFMVTPIYFLNTLNDVAALMFARGAEFLAVFEKPHREAFTMLFLRLHDHGVQVNEVFWGLWLFPLGILSYRSHFIPRFIGVWLMINCFAYLAMSVTGILFPAYQETVGTVVFPFTFGELALILWLIIRGARPPVISNAPAVLTH